MENKVLFTSESVTEGHPDKLCDFISDSILDAYLIRDPYARVAVETTATTGLISVMGQITSRASVDIKTLVRETVKEAGYQDDRFGFNGNTCAVMIMIDKQSEDINACVSHALESRQATGETGASAQGRDAYDDIGAGDQGMMFGYACNETRSLMPAPIYYAHQLCKRMSYLRKNNQLKVAGPDGKAMVTVEYIDGQPARVDTVVLSTQHTADADLDKLRDTLIAKVIRPMIPEKLMRDTRMLINPSGRFVHGGPSADTGLTGRKIVVDTYGGAGRHGGGAFSGKDPTKVDRTGAYAARHIAKNIVAAQVAERCEVQLAYAIGVAKPVSIQVNTFGTGTRADGEIAQMVASLFDLRPAYLIESFQLRKPLYKRLAAYGHFGRAELDLPWEKIDKVADIRSYFANTEQGREA